jgi:predicted hydrocarbon binding protein
MNQLHPPTYHYADEMGHILLLALQEVLGSQGTKAILVAADLSDLAYRAFTGSPNDGLRFEQVSRIQDALEDFYGLQGGQGVAMRCGRTSFKYGLREFGERSGFTDLEFRLLPINDRVRVGTELLARVFNDHTGHMVKVSNQADRYIWEIERCPVCWGRHASGVSCHLAVGILQESLFWVSGGKYFNVKETHCIAKGDRTCTIVVNKKPLDQPGQYPGSGPPGVTYA